MAYIYWHFFAKFMVAYYWRKPNIGIYSNDIIRFCYSLQFLKSQLSKEWYILVISFLSMLVLVRYTARRYLIVLLSFASVYTFIYSASNFSIYKKNVAIGLSFMFLIVIGSLLKDIREIKLATNHVAPWSMEQKQ